MEYYEKLQSEINRLGDPIGNAELIRDVKEQNNTHQGIYDTTIENLKSQMEKIDETIEKTRRALDE